MDTGRCPTPCPNPTEVARLGQLFFCCSRSGASPSSRARLVLIPALRLSRTAVCAATELSVRCSQDLSDLRTPSVLCPDRRGEPVITTADAMLEEHARIKSDPPKVPGCNLETVIAGIMLWSDSTHLASFGNAALWPIYLFVGNQSKYARAKPSAFAAHHLAYIPKVSLT